jgi:hypothetical protein
VELTWRSLREASPPRSGVLILRLVQLLADIVQTEPYIEDTSCHLEERDLHIALEALVKINGLVLARTRYYTLYLNTYFEVVHYKITVRHLLLQELMFVSMYR